MRKLERVARLIISASRFGRAKTGISVQHVLRHEIPDFRYAPFGKR